MDGCKGPTSVISTISGKENRAKTIGQTCTPYSHETLVGTIATISISSILLRKSKTLTGVGVLPHSVERLPRYIVLKSFISKFDMVLTNLD